MPAGSVVRVGYEDADCFGEYHTSFLSVTDRQFLQ